MPDIYKENKIIDSIYECVLHPEHWVSVLQEIVEYTQSKAAIFTIVDQLNPCSDFVYSYNLPKETIAAYQDEKIKVIDMRLHANLWEGLGVGEFLQKDVRHYCSSQNQDEYVFYDKCLKPAGVGHLAGVLLDRGEYKWAVLAIHRAADMPFYTEKQENFLKRIGTHVRRALQLHKQISILENKNHDLYQLLDQLKIGLILLDETLSLNYANQQAQHLMKKSKCLLLDQHNHLKIHKQHELDEILQRTLRSSGHEIDRVGGILSLGDASGGHLMLSVMPFLAIQQSFPHSKIALVLTDQNQKYTLPFIYLKQKYQISKREFQLCECLVNGYKFEEIAIELGISLNSVRTYFKYIYEKMNASSQIELMHVLMGCTIQFEHIAS